MKQQVQTKQESEDTMLTTGAVARRLGVSNQTVRRLIWEGILPALQLKKHWRVRESDVNAYIEAHTKR